MEVALTLVAFVAIVLLVAGLSDRFELPPPMVLIAVGAGASFLPGVPEIELAPEVVLLGLLPPLLYSAALQTSLVEFRANWRSILLLSVGLVAFTTLGVGMVVHAVLPVEWPVAFALGAVVAPPDAVAASAIARRIGLPRRLVTVLEGESLLNDATALVALRTALAGAASVVAVGRDFALAAGGGVLIGLIGFAIVSRVRRRLTDVVLDGGLSLVTPFACYVVAEAVHVSGVLAVVVAGLLLGHKAPILQTAQSRLAERTTWRTIAFLLEGSVFLLIGLQARWILRGAATSPLSPARIVVVCLAALVAVIVLRLIWVFPARYLLVRPGPDPQTGQRTPWSVTFLLGWAGMRGVVTLAAAFVLPGDTPHRDVLVLAAFTVVAGTLFLQGMSLPWLARRLNVTSPDPSADALARATLLQHATAAGLAELNRHDEPDPQGVADAIRDRVAQRGFAAWEQLRRTTGDETPSQTYARRRLAMLAAERAAVLQVRNTGTVPHEVVSEVLGMLDLEESTLVGSTGEEERPGPLGVLAAGPMSRRRRLAARALAAVGRPEAGSALRQQDSSAGVNLGFSPMETSCTHLQEAGESRPRTPGSCEECVRRGMTWVHLRVCVACGQVGCCDSSLGKHATVHHQQTGHPVIESGEPGESWRWCYIDDVVG